MKKATDRALGRGKRALRRLGESKPATDQAPAPDSPTPRRPPGTAKDSMFFDEFPRFYTTSETSAYRDRLNLRYEAIFGENRDVFSGARVIDLASHDGRWSLAALKAGAAEVIGIEARDDLVRAARTNLDHYCNDGEAYEFIAGDIFEVTGDVQMKADVVLCLGFLYHTLRYNELMSRIRDMKPRYLIVDTQVLPQEPKRFVRLRLDRVDRQQNAAADAYSHDGRTLVGKPSVPALEYILNAFGFEIERFSDWGSLVRDNPRWPGVRAYADGRRVTLRCVSTS
jgi:predicted nicotinamide N-methyase